MSPPLTFGTEMAGDFWNIYVHSILEYDINSAGIAISFSLLKAKCLFNVLVFRCQRKNYNGTTKYHKYLYVSCGTGL